MPVKRVGCAGASEDAKRCTPVPLSLAWRLRQAGGFGVVGNFGAPVEVDGGVGFARGDDLDAAGGEQGAQADVEGEVDGFFELAAVEVGAGIVAAVGCIEDYDEAGVGRGGAGRRGGADGCCAGRATARDARQ